VFCILQNYEASTKNSVEPLMGTLPGKDEIGKMKDKEDGRRMWFAV
jgi:hypothetical protein